MHNCGDLASCPFTVMSLGAGEGWIEILYKFARKTILQCIFPPFRPDTLKSYHKKSQTDSLWSQQHLSLSCPSKRGLTLILYC